MIFLQLFGSCQTFFILPLGVGTVVNEKFGNFYAFNNVEGCFAVVICEIGVTAD